MKTGFGLGRYHKGNSHFCKGRSVYTFDLWILSPDRVRCSFSKGSVKINQGFRRELREVRGGRGGDDGTRHGVSRERDG